jgi:hypothetical protein
MRIVERETQPTSKCQRRLNQDHHSPLNYHKWQQSLLQIHSEEMHLHLQHESKWKKMRSFFITNFQIQTTHPFHNVDA